MSERTPIRRKDDTPRRVLVRRKILAGAAALLFLGTSLLVAIDELTREDPAAARLALDEQPSLGHAEAPVSLVMFARPACEACADFVLGPELDAVFREFIASGRARIHYVDAPGEAGPWERRARVAAECVARQSDEGFWVLLTRYYDDVSALNATDVEALARGVVREQRLDLAALDACVDGSDAMEAVAADARRAVAFEATGAPAFVVLDATGRALPVRGVDDVRAALLRAGA